MAFTDILKALEDTVIKGYFIWFIFTLAVLSAPGVVLAQTDDKLTINDLWLGQTFEEVSTRSKEVFPSRILPGGEVISVGDAGAHFLDGRAQLLGGTTLKSGTETVLQCGQSRKQVLAATTRRGWIVEKTWESGSDVADHKYSVLRLEPNNNVTLLLVFFRTTHGKQEILEEVYLRSNEVKGPYGDV